MKKVGFVLCLASGLVACSSLYTSQGEKQYLDSRNGPKLIIPPPLTGDNLSPFYDLPPETQNARVSIAPPGG